MFIHGFNCFRFHLVCPGIQTVYKPFLHGLNGCGDSICRQWTYWWKSDNFLQLEVSLDPFLLLQNHKWSGPGHGMLNWQFLMWLMARHWCAVQLALFAVWTQQSPQLLCWVLFAFTECNITEHVRLPPVLNSSWISWFNAHQDSGCSVHPACSVN
jgi:hypothetical protein